MSKSKCEEEYQLNRQFFTINQTTGRPPYVSLSKINLFKTCSCLRVLIAVLQIEEKLETEFA